MCEFLNLHLESNEMCVCGCPHDNAYSSECVHVCVCVRAYEARCLYVLCKAR